MGWEARGSGRYYYRKHKQGGKVHSEYVGAGYAGLLSEQLTKAARLDAEYKRQAWAAIKEEEERLDKIVDDMTLASQQLVTALMLVTGHHQHKRQWRRKR